MDQRRQIDIGFVVDDQFDKAPIDAVIFRRLFVDQYPLTADKAAAAAGENKVAGVGLDADVPALRAGLAPIEFGADRQPAIV
jgi:hypothetical protein